MQNVLNFTGHVTCSTQAYEYATDILNLVYIFIHLIPRRFECLAYRRKLK